MKCKTCITKAICRNREYEELFTICPFLYRKFKITLAAPISFIDDKNSLIKDLYESLEPTTWSLIKWGPNLSFIQFTRRK